MLARPELCRVPDSFDPCYQAPGSVRGVRPTVRPGREDGRQEIGAFQPSIFEPEQVGFGKGRGNAD
jgi:hypothetical protein